MTMCDNINLFTLSKSAINAIKKPKLIQTIITLKEKVIMDSDKSNIRNQISNLNDLISHLDSRNQKIRIELAVVKSVNIKLEERIISLENSKAKSEQYSRRINTELSGIPNDIPESNLKKVVTDIFHSSGFEIEPKDIEDYHCLQVSRHSRNSNRRVIIIKLLKRKHPEALL